MITFDLVFWTVLIMTVLGILYFLVATLVCHIQDAIAEREWLAYNEGYANATAKFAPPF